jgi:hemolysin activation/secretion protein
MFLLFKSKLLIVLALVTCFCAYAQDAALKKLVFFDDLGNKSEHIGDAEGVYFLDIDVPNPALFEEEMSFFMGKTISMDLVTEVRESVLNYYHERGRSVVRVIFPSGQDVTDGDLRILIIGGRLGKVHVIGDKDYFSTEKIAQEIRTQPGEYINNDKMLEDVSWINRNPFRSVKVVYERAEQLGTTDVLLEMHERRPYRIYADVDRSTYLVAGSCRYKTGFSLGKVFNLDHQLSGQVSVGSSMKRLWGWSANYTAPLPWRHIAKVFGGQVWSQPGTSTLGIQGKSHQVGCRYIIPLPVAFGSLSQEVTLGYDFRRTNNFFDYLKPEYNTKNIDVSQFMVRYEGSYEFEKDVLTFGASVFVNPSNMSAYDKDEYYEVARPGAKARHAYLLLNADNLYRLPYSNSTLMTTGKIQYAFKKLIPTQQMALGGWATIRGYKENAVIGDTGILLRNELRSEPYNFMTFKNIPSKLQVLGFLDTGCLFGVRQDVYHLKSIALASVGAGLRYNIAENVDVKFDYGCILRKINSSDSGSGVHASITATY